MTPVVTPPRLEARELAKRYGGVRALKGVSLSIAPGEVLCLAGENGCGKSTFSKIVSGVISHDAGTMSLDGQDISALSPMKRMVRGIHVIYQDFSLFPNLSVAENIYLVKQSCVGQSLVDRNRGRQETAAILESIGVELDPDCLVEDLAVGEKQSVAIARAMIQNAKLIIMDEPTTALTEREIARLLGIVRKLAATGVSFIFVSHKLEEVLEISDRVVVLRNGEKTLDRTAQGLTEVDITVAMIGSELPPPPVRNRPAGGGGAPLLRLKGLGREDSFGNVDVTLERGEIIGLSGRLGSGRTALSLALFGAEPAMSGAIEIDGRATAIRSIADAISHGIAYVPEDRLTEGLFLPKSIGENIALRAFDRLKGRFGLLDGGKMAAEAQKWVRDLAINTPSHELAAQALSGGNQQRVVLAKWLASNPRILILNRPTVGVDVGSKYELHKTIRAVADAGVGIIVISDEFPELLALSDKILFMENGRIERESDPANAQAKVPVSTRVLQ